jgi:3-phenylpropionate/trans-cinnamate dioxygenase ferredoxin subunit
MSEIIELSLAELAEGGMSTVLARERDIVVCRTKAGVFAVDNVCTHAYARLSEGRLRGTRLICPLHGASFDVRDGRALGAPATRPLACHAVRIEGERIIVEVSSAARDTPGFTP